MDHEREPGEFRRMEIIAKRERAERLIADYRRHVDFYRERIDWCNDVLGRIAQRLGEPEEREPRWE
jgi:hypothetical protein